MARAREKSGRTLEEITAATKIRKDYLAAIEAGEFGRLPGGLFPRAFLRAYARQVGLDAEKVVAEYRELVAPEEAAGQGTGGGGGRRQLASMELKGRGNGGRFGGSGGARPVPAKHGGGWVGVLIAVAVIAGIVYWGQRAKTQEGESARRGIEAREAGTRHRRRETEREAESARRTAEQRSGATAPAGAPIPAGSVPGAGASQRSPVAPTRMTAQTGTVVPAAAGLANTRPGEAGSAPQARRVTVAVAASAPVWIHLSSAGKTVVEMTLAAGQSVSYRVPPPLSLVTGNAGGTQVTVNGTAQPSLGAAGVVARWEYPPGTVQVIPPLKPPRTAGAGKPAAKPSAQPKTRTPAAGPAGKILAVKPRTGTKSAPATSGGGLKPAAPGTGAPASGGGGTGSTGREPAPA